MKTRIKSYLSFKYNEVYEITQWKGRCIFKTKRLNKFITAANAKDLDTDNFVTSSISTSITHPAGKDTEFIVLDVEEASYFVRSKNEQ